MPLKYSRILDLIGLSRRKFRHYKQSLLSPLVPTPSSLVEFYHTVHPGRTQFGVPLKVRQWIQKNPRSTPFAQREELLLAIKRGEIPGIQLNSRFLCPSLIHYWWRKIYGKTAYISDDPWENAAHLLREHPFVQALYHYLN